MVSILVGLGLSALGLSASAGVAYSYVKIADYVASKVTDDVIEYKDYLIEEKSLKPGDHIYVPGGISATAKAATNKALYYHHMIYLGDGKIAEYGCKNSQLYPVIGNRQQYSKIYRREYKKCISTEETISLCKRLDHCIDYGNIKFLSEPEPRPPQPKSEQLWGHETFIASANWITKGRFFASLRAGIADIQPPPEDTSPLTTAAKVCTVGVDAQVEKKYSGVGVEATLVSVNVDAGNFAGLRLGISGDSSVGIGTEKMSVKVAGTGFKMDESGTELTVLGTGIKLGSWVTVYGWPEKIRKMKN